MSDYTPTTDQMRECATSSWDIAWLTPEVFDRWLAAEKAKWTKEVLEKVAEKVRSLHFNLCILPLGFDGHCRMCDNNHANEGIQGICHECDRPFPCGTLQMFAAVLGEVEKP